MNRNKYRETDKQITKEIMKEFEGEVIESKCDEPGCDENCEHCGGTGTVKVQY